MTSLLFCNNDECGTPNEIYPYMARPDLLWVKCKGCDTLIPLYKPLKELAKESIK